MMTVKMMRMRRTMKIRSLKLMVKVMRMVKVARMAMMRTKMMRVFSMCVGSTDRH